MADIADDIALRVKKNSARLVPESGPVGYYLRKTGPGVSDYEFVQGPRDEILQGIGDPNGVHEAPMGVLYVETDAPALWQNTDGATGWQLVGTGVPGSFPISYDDGTWTYELTAVSGMMRISVTEDADPTNIVTFDLLPPTSSISSPDGFNLTSTNNGATIEIHANDDGFISLAAGTIVEINTDFGSGDVSIGEANSQTVDLVSQRVRFFQNAAPADAALANSSFSFWLDDTPGTTILNIKAKDSAGTVRTAAIPLL